jgi:long-chain acyl-CoA synthetase
MEPRRNFDLLAYAAAQYPTNVLFAEKQETGWKTYNPKEVISLVDNLSFGLLYEEFGPGHKAAIMSFNCPAWNFCDYAISQSGGITVPLYPTLSAKDLAFILQDSECSYVFVQNTELAEKVKEAAPSVKIFTFEDSNAFPHYSELEDLGKSNPNPGKLQGYKDSVNTEDLMTLIYTSGTTGMPKGVMLSHQNVLSNVNTIAELYPEFGEKRVLSFLPLCHIFERMVGYVYTKLGASIYYAESMEKIADNLKEVKPYGFTTVPRLLEKVYDKIVAKGGSLGGIKKALFFWALRLGQEYEFSGKSWWYKKQLSLADRLIFSKWREALGGQVEVIVCGAAALQPRLARVFTAAGISVLEGYGLTETSPVIAANGMQIEKRKFGSVGPVIPGVEVQLAEDGEIICKGPGVMMGYYKQPELTAEVLNGEGWLKTGDIGTMEDGKFLRITDRKKEVFKTSGGKFVAPQPLENAFKESPYIEQIMVVGENKKYAAALIVPSFDNLKNWCESHTISWTSNSEMVKHPKILELIQQDIDAKNQDFGSWEQIKSFRLLSREWDVENGELTPTLKLKRKAIATEFEKEIEELFA